MTEPRPPQKPPAFSALLRASLLVCGGALVLAGLAWLFAHWFTDWTKR